MEMYTRIADYYDLLFPVDCDSISFVENVLTGRRVSQDRFLDLGCATGTLLLALSKRFKHLYGIDVDSALLLRAEQKLGPDIMAKAEMLEASMKDLDMLFPEEEFSCITCMGNTMPHLLLPEINTFLHNVFQHLESGGVFIFQNINYDRVLDLSLRGLPTLEQGEVTFSRYYSLPKTNGRIDFDTILSDPEHDREIRNSIELTPLRKTQLEEYLTASGFTRLNFYGSFAGTPWSEDSYLTIGVCS